MRRLILFLAVVAAPAWAGPFSSGDARIVFLGEQHDNPAHHVRQAEIVAGMRPRALVFEMLTAEQAALVTPELVADPAAMEAALGWADSGWPDFAMYHPIFEAAPGAAVYGAAVPRETARRVMAEGIAPVFGRDAPVYGLADPLPETQQAAREALQFAAHCEAMPAEMMPMMVDIQRLRDAQLARTALKALNETGGPVAVITGNGHARSDWGAPSVLALVAPEVRVRSLGQGEAASGAPEGVFDIVEIGPDVERGDPCEAFAG